MHDIDRHFAQSRGAYHLGQLPDPAPPRAYKIARRLFVCALVASGIGMGWHLTHDLGARIEATFEQRAIGACALAYDGGAL